MVTVIQDMLNVTIAVATSLNSNFPSHNAPLSLNHNVPMSPNHHTPLVAQVSDTSDVLYDAEVDIEAHLLGTGDVVKGGEERQEVATVENGVVDDQQLQQQPEL